MILKRCHRGLDDARLQSLLHEHEKAYASGRKINHKGHQGVSECKIGDNIYMIKYYRPKSLFATIRLCLGQSRIDRSFCYADLLDKEGIAIARHLLAVKHLAFSGSRSYLVMEKAPGTAMFEFIQRGTDLRISEQAIENIAALVTDMHKQGIAHGDLHTRNLIIAEDDSVRLIDFDNARKSKSGVRKDLIRFQNAISISSNYEPIITAAMRRRGHPLLNDKPPR